MSEEKEFDYIVDTYGDFHIRRGTQILLEYKPQIGSYDEVKEIVNRLNGDFFKDD